MKNDRPFWAHPWNFKESFTIAFALLFIGFLMEATTANTGPTMPQWPFNLIIILAFCGFVALSYFTIKHPIIKWFSSTSAAISAISVMTFLILLMGFIRQDDPMASGFVQRIGLTHITSSWPYFITSVYLLTVLAYATVRRSYPFSIKNTAFFLNHAGLLLVIISASLGQADMEKLSMRLYEGRAEFSAADDQGRIRQMPFAIKLNDFSIQEYPATIGIIDKNTSRFDLGNEGHLPEAIEGLKFESGDWSISITKLLTSALPDSTGFSQSEEMGSAPAVYARATNNKTQQSKEGWISNGSYLFRPSFIHLSANEALALSIPRPKEFSSDIRFFHSMQKYEDHTIKVNEPLNIRGWTIYQVGYNEDLGKWSNISIIQLVRDPWLPAVYTGIFMILLGSIYLVWMGKNKNTK